MGVIMGMLFLLLIEESKKAEITYFPVTDFLKEFGSIY
jgi:hypothetical protein